MALRTWAAILTLGIAAALLTPATATAHGMHYSLEPASGTYAFTVGFSGGEIASYAACTIHGPDASEFQTGRTDAHGRFAFTPDRPGAWRVEVDGGMGHRIEFEVPVSQRATTKPHAPRTTTELDAATLLTRTALGISFVLNLFLVPALLRRRSTPT